MQTWRQLCLSKNLLGVFSFRPKKFVEKVFLGQTCIFWSTGSNVAHQFLSFADVAARHIDHEPVQELPARRVCSAGRVRVCGGRNAKLDLASENENLVWQTFVVPVAFAAPVGRLFLLFSPHDVSFAQRRNVSAAPVRMRVYSAARSTAHSTCGSFCTCVGVHSAPGSRARPSHSTCRGRNAAQVAPDTQRP